MACTTTSRWRPDSRLYPAGVTLALFGDSEISVSSGVIDAPGALHAADSALLTLFGTDFEVDTGSGFPPWGLPEGA